MHRRPTLYKINRHAAEGVSIAVETAEASASNKPHILFCGGFHSTMCGIKATFLSDLCQHHGWGFTRFDYQGHGISDALVEHCSLHDWLGDTLAVVDHLTEKKTHAKPIIVGSSMGAWLAVHAAMQRPEKISALLTIAAAPDFTQALLWPALSESQRKAVSDDRCVSIPTHYDGSDWRVRSCLFASGRELALLGSDTIINLNMPIRMLHGTADADVPWTFSHQLLEKFIQCDSASLILIRGGDHRLSDKHSLAEIESALSWLDNLLFS